MADYLTQLFGLEGKVVALTGGGGHICSELSRAFARAGCGVAVLDVRLHKAEEVATELRDAGANAMAFELDVRNKGEWSAALTAILAHFGRLDLLVNGAGHNAPTPPLDVALEDWQQIFAVNLEGTFLGCQVVGAHLLASGGGAIVNISSASADPPLSKAFAYSASKAGVRNLTQNLAREWATQGVRVNALRPGFFPTKWSQEHFIDADREAAILGHTAMKRYGEPHELVGAVLWLCSDAAGFVTGAEIAVDGGFSAMTL